MSDKNEMIFAPLDDTEFPSAVEAVLFAAGDPLDAQRLADILGIETNRLVNIMDELTADYSKNTRRGIYIRKIEGAYTLSTKPSSNEVVKRLFTPKNRPPMSQASYETLAIVAYNQPVTRAQIESVRGVSSDGVIARLLEKDLIRECGTLDAPGRPVLFETTVTFLKEFGFSSVHDLPPMDMLMYKTLQDIEDSVAGAAGAGNDVQITIEQLAATIRTKDPQNDEAYKSMSDDCDQDQGELSDTNVMDISSAFFGEE